MFFLLSVIWAIVVVQPNPPAVGEAATKELAQDYIDIVTSPGKLVWTSYTGPNAEGHNILKTAKAGDTGTVYETSLEDGTRRITLLVGAYLNNVAAGLTHFRNLYDEKFNRSAPTSSNCVGTGANPLHLKVVEGTRGTEYPLLTDQQKAELRNHKVEVVPSTFGEILQSDGQNHSNRSPGWVKS